MIRNTVALIQKEPSKAFSWMMLVVQIMEKVGEEEKLICI